MIGFTTHTTEMSGDITPQTMENKGESSMELEANALEAFGQFPDTPEAVEEKRAGFEIPCSVFIILFMLISLGCGFMYRSEIKSFITKKTVLTTETSPIIGAERVSEEMIVLKELIKIAQTQKKVSSESDSESEDFEAREMMDRLANVTISVKADMPFKKCRIPGFFDTEGHADSVFRFHRCGPVPRKGFWCDPEQTEEQYKFDPTHKSLFFDFVSEEGFVLSFILDKDHKKGEGMFAVQIRKGSFGERIPLPCLETYGIYEFHDKNGACNLDNLDHEREWPTIIRRFLENVESNLNRLDWAALELESKVAKGKYAPQDVLVTLLNRGFNPAQRGAPSCPEGTAWKWRDIAKKADSNGYVAGLKFSVSETN